MDICTNPLGLGDLLFLLFRGRVASCGSMDKVKNSESSAEARPRSFSRRNKGSRL